MPRPQEPLASAAAALDAALGRDQPPWVSPASWRAARALVERLRRDAIRTVDASTREAAGEALEVSRDTIHRWMRDGWLAPRDET